MHHPECIVSRRSQVATHHTNMALRILVILSLLIAGVAVFLTLDVFQSSRLTVHTSLRTLYATCPYHWFRALFGLEGTGSHEANDGSVYDVIRYGQDKLYSKEELSHYDGGEDSKGLYLGILGLVYDVAEGSQHYGPGKGYGFFAGKDGTKAFMTGQFNEEGLVDEATGLSLPQMIELENWIKFYDKTYIYKGKLIGNFYDASGQPSAALLECGMQMEAAHENQRKQEEERKLFPPCNSHWTKETGVTVWCSEKSGGVQHDWIGVPRKLYKPGKKTSRCVCIRTTGPPSDGSSGDRGDLDNPNLKDYEGCEPTSDTCLVPPS